MSMYHRENKLSVFDLGLLVKTKDPCENFLGHWLRQVFHNVEAPLCSNTVQKLVHTGSDSFGKHLDIIGQKRTESAWPYATSYVQANRVLLEPSVLQVCRHRERQLRYQELRRKPENPCSSFDVVVPDYRPKATRCVAVNCRSVLAHRSVHPQTLE